MYGRSVADRCAEINLDLPSRSARRMPAESLIAMPNPTVSPAALEGLMRRIGRYLETKAGDLDWTYQDDHPATLLAEAETMLHELGDRGGLVRLPRPVAKPVPADILDDLTSHRRAWLAAFDIAKAQAEVSPPDIDDAGYWAHERAAFVRLLDAMTAHFGETDR